MTDYTETDRLPKSARGALLYVADMLREKFTGRIEFDCRSGGVARVRVIVDHSGDELAKHNGTK